MENSVKLSTILLPVFGLSFMFFLGSIWDRFEASRIRDFLFCILLVLIGGLAFIQIVFVMARIDRQADSQTEEKTKIDLTFGKFEKVLSVLICSTFLGQNVISSIPIKFPPKDSLTLISGIVSKKELRRESRYSEDLVIDVKSRDGTETFFVSDHFRKTINDLHAGEKITALEAPFSTGVLAELFSESKVYFDYDNYKMMKEQEHGRHSWFMYFVTMVIVLATIFGWRKLPNA